MKKHTPTQDQMDWRRSYETRDDGRKQDAMEIIGSAVALLAMFALAWLFCIATPSQRSAEADWFDAQCHEKGVAQ